MLKIYVFFGMVASGKSTLARYFADRCGLPYYNTDRVRKELAGLDPSSRRPDAVKTGIYTDEFSRKTYQAMLDRALEDFKGGRPGVVLDGSYHSAEERARVRDFAAACDAACVFIQCVCSEDEVRKRLERRSRDPEAVSDGRLEIYLLQKKNFVPPDELKGSELVVFNTEGGVEALFGKLLLELDMNL